LNLLPNCISLARHDPKEYFPDVISCSSFWQILSDITAFRPRFIDFLLAWGPGGVVSMSSIVDWFD
jgi:hypothetical protein